MKRNQAIEEESNILLEIFHFIGYISMYLYFIRQTKLYENQLVMHIDDCQKCFDRIAVGFDEQKSNPAFFMFSDITKLGR